MTNTANTYVTFFKISNTSYWKALLKRRESPFYYRTYSYIIAIWCQYTRQKKAYLSYLARKKQLLIIIFKVVGGFVFYDHSFKIHQSSRISLKESSTSSILPFRKLIGNFPGVDYYINFATSIKNNGIANGLFLLIPLKKV